jgi:quercetin dioxygenase-like cupin family protein
MTALASIPAFAVAGNSADYNREKEPFVINAGNNRSGSVMMKYMGIHPNDVVISRKDTADALSVFIFTGHGVVGTPLHIHYHQDEFFTVIEGRYRFVCGDLKKELNAGDTIFLPRNIPHQWLQVSDFGKLIYAVNPAGKLEDFFQEANNLKEASPEKIDQLALKYGMKHIGPPMAL